MTFLLQSDNVSVIETRVVRQATMLTDELVFRASLAGLPAALQLIDREVVPVGTLEFVTEVMRLRHIPQPPNLTYPEVLHPFLQRRVWTGTLGERHKDSNVFVKPQHAIKHFTGALRHQLDVVLPNDFPVWFSEPVTFVSEWRYYVINNTLVGAGRYDDGADDAPVPDLRLVNQAIKLLNPAPAGYALDFGVLADGRTALVEVNDGWALGYYKGEDVLAGTPAHACSPVDYARLLKVRWTELLATAMKSV